MRFLNNRPDKKGLKKIRDGVHAFESSLDDEERRLAELFRVLKHELLSSLSSSLDVQHVRTLKKQVRHVISIARAVEYPSLEKSFSEEEEILNHLQDILEQYPAADLSSSADVNSAIKNLRSLIERQQEMIFKHKEILLHEKQRLVEILQETQSLEEYYEKDHSSSA